MFIFKCHVFQVRQILTLFSHLGFLSPIFVLLFLPLLLLDIEELLIKVVLNLSCDLVFSSSDASEKHILFTNDSLDSVTEFNMLVLVSLQSLIVSALLL